MKFHVKLSDYNATQLEGQVATALEKMVEQDSRAAAPGVWKVTDRLNATPKATDQVLEKRRSRRKIYGVILLALGVMILVPALMDLENMIIPMIVGAWATIFGVVHLIPRKTPTNQFLESARKILGEKPPYNDILFRNEAILLGGSMAVDYNKITHLLETADCYIIIFEKGMAVIQKRDIPQAKDDLQEDFRHFVARQSKLKWI